MGASNLEENKKRRQRCAPVGGYGQTQRHPRTCGPRWPDPGEASRCTTARKHEPEWSDQLATPWQGLPSLHERCVLTLQPLASSNLGAGRTYGCCDFWAKGLELSDHSLNKLKRYAPYRGCDCWVHGPLFRGHLSALYFLIREVTLPHRHRHWRVSIPRSATAWSHQSPGSCAGWRWTGQVHVSC